MTGNIIKFPGQTTADLSAEQVLLEASKVEFDSVYVVGTTKDGEFYMASTTSDMGWASMTHKRMGMMIDDLLRGFD